MAFGINHAKAAIKRRRARVKVRTRQLRGARRKLEQSKQWLARSRQARDRYAKEGEAWGGSRAVTNDVIRIVNGRAAVTSRKRAANDPLSAANPGSDHNAANGTADAVDFGIANAYSLGSEIARKLGGSWSEDYGEFYTRKNNHWYRVQIIAGQHGTGPHLHVGVRRALSPK